MVNYTAEDMPFVPLDQEAEYMQKHGLAKVALANGITVLSAHELAEDIVHGKVELTLATGSYNDPKDKSGMHHLLEHLAVNPQLGRASHYLGVDLNASTTIDGVSLIIDGTANPEVREFGLWPFLSGFRDMFTQPLSHYPDFDQALETQRAIVLREIAERSEDESRKINKFRNAVIYGIGNPYRTNNVGGVSEEVASITKEEMLDLSRQIFVTNKTVVTVSSQGNLDVYQALIDQIYQRFEPIPDTKTASNPVDRNKYQILNPDFQAGNVFEMPATSIKDISSIDLIWLFQIPYESITDAAMMRFAKLVRPHISDYVRDNGLSYGASVYQMQDNSDLYSFFVISTKLANQPNLASEVTTSFIPRIKKLISGLPNEELEDPYENLKQKAIPISKNDRNNSFLGSHFKYGRIYDVDEMKRRSGLVQTADIKSWRDQILDTNPTVLIY